MPARKFKPDMDFYRLKEVTEANISMLTAMHGALTEIACCEVSLDGGIAQKHIAENALITVHNIAAEMEVQDAEVSH